MLDKYKLQLVIRQLNVTVSYRSKMQYWDCNVNNINILLPNQNVDILMC